MALRASIPLTICITAGAVAAVGLARPGNDNGAVTAGGYGVAAETVETTVPPSAGSEAGPVERAEAAPASIGISGFAFESGVIVAPGQTVQVPNGDGAPHTLSATGGEFDTGNVDGGQTGSFVAPTTPGTYEFFCRLHPSMTGTLTVSA